MLLCIPRHHSHYSQLQWQPACTACASCTELASITSQHACARVLFTRPASSQSHISHTRLPLPSVWAGIVDSTCRPAATAGSCWGPRRRGISAEEACRGLSPPRRRADRRAATAVTHARRGRTAAVAARLRRGCWRRWRVGWRRVCHCGSVGRCAPSWSSQAAIVAAARRFAFLTPFGRSIVSDCLRSVMPQYAGCWSWSLSVCAMVTSVLCLVTRNLPGESAIWELEHPLFALPRLI